MSLSTTERWYEDWQSRAHADTFDFRSRLGDQNLIRSYESLNDVRILNERFGRSTSLSLLEVGCATAEFYRYLRLKYPRIQYYGVDISRPAIEIARRKYPAAKLSLADAGRHPVNYLEISGLADAAGIVYAKDVAHHQTKPLDFVANLIGISKVALVMRCRTRDIGPTENDPELSCQYHYGGWMPYIITNLDELVRHIQEMAPRSEIVVYRNHMILGGKQGRFLPKDCYLEETGTAETAVGVFLKTDSPAKVTIQNRSDQNPSYTFVHHLRLAAQRVGRMMRSRER